MKRIGLLTSGGDCQALNATMRGVVKGLFNNLDELEVYGFDDGYKGLIYGNYRMLSEKDFSGILTRGGTILGTSRQPFKLMRVPDEKGLDKVEAMKQTYYKLRLDCLVILGGNGTQKTANLLREEGLNVLHLPKTIDNDIWGTDMTFGFQSAVDIATDAIDCIHTTAASHSRVFIVEVMGHKVGWLTLHAGIAGGADIILIPEIPYDIKKIAEAVRNRNRAGKGFTILAVAEGAISKEDAALPKKEMKKKLEEYQKIYPSVAYKLEAELKNELDLDIRITIPGHMQRGGSPCPYDRVLSTRLGSAAAGLILKGEYGYMVGIVNGKVKKVPLEECAGKLKTVAPDDQLVKAAKRIGISFGD
ncbi:MAG: ATP-dependent 6-phosphofructokinase [Firmicutes bacterium]|nr:6-phosphofructokinase [Blautia sp.]MDD7371640.1 ATP-dependent 6-phosphofructokinase [Bacillota bacterium]MDY3714988.1 ATP-dependent 6-phosphofructokinase [Blautia sp.]